MHISPQNVNKQRKILILKLCASQDTWVPKQMILVFAAGIRQDLLEFLCLTYSFSVNFLRNCFFYLEWLIRGYKEQLENSLSTVLWNVTLTGHWVLNAASSQGGQRQQGLFGWHRRTRYQECSQVRIWISSRLGVKGTTLFLWTLLNLFNSIWGNWRVGKYWDTDGHLSLRPIRRRDGRGSRV